MWLIRAEIVWQGNGSKGRRKLPEFYLGGSVLSEEDAEQTARLVIDPWRLVAPDCLRITAERVPAP